MAITTNKAAAKQAHSVHDAELNALFFHKKTGATSPPSPALTQFGDNAILQLLQKQLEARYLALLSVFKKRLSEDPSLFSQIGEQSALEVFEAMARLMLQFHPTRISADVTTDASIILQGHFGPVRVYWEIFFPTNSEETYYSTLNAYENQTLVYTNGGNAGQIVGEFIDFITPMFHKYTRLEITF